jgi:ribosomal protein S18 acetylase RimI-like enzyme
MIGVAYVRTPNENITPWNLLRWLFVTREVGCAWRLLQYIIGVTNGAPKGRHFVVLLIGIEPDYQGLGYGTTLMRAVHEFCDQRAEATDIVLDTGNARNVCFYEALGYREVTSFRLGDVRQRIMLRR